MPSQSRTARARRPILICLVVLLAPFLLSRPAHADKVAKAKEIYLEGVEAYRAERFVDAAEKFRESYELSGRTTLLFNIAATWEEAGRKELALKFYKHYLAENWDAPNRPEVEAKMETLDKEIRAAWPTVTINTKPQGASVRLGAGSSAQVGESPATFQVAPGRHRIVAAKAGHTTEFMDIKVVADTPQSVTISLKESKGTGKVALRIRPKGAAVTINGDPIGIAPFAEPLELSEGNYWVTVEAEEYAPWTSGLVVTRDKTAKLVVTLASTRPPERFPYESAALWTGVGATAAIAGGLAFGWGAQQIHDELSEVKANGRTPDTERMDQGRLYLGVETALLAVGIAAALTAGTMWLIADAPPAQSPVVPSSQAEPPDAESSEAEPSDAKPSDAEPSDAEPSDAEPPAQAEPDPPTAPTETSLVPWVGPGGMGLALRGTL